MLQVLSPPYIFSRWHVWAGTNCFLACILLLKAKTRMPGMLQFVDQPDPAEAHLRQANVVACLKEVSHLFFNYGWFGASGHACLWAVLENEAVDSPAKVCFIHEFVRLFIALFCCLNLVLVIFQRRNEPEYAPW